MEWRLPRFVIEPWPSDEIHRLRHLTLRAPSFWTHAIAEARTVSRAAAQPFDRRGEPQCDFDLRHIAATRRTRQGPRKAAPIRQVTMSGRKMTLDQRARVANCRNGQNAGNVERARQRPGPVRLTRHHAAPARSKSGTFAMLAAMRLASSLVNRFMLMRRTDSSSK